MIDMDNKQQNYFQALYQQVMQMVNRVRLIEERYEQLSMKVKIIDESSLKRTKELKEMIIESQTDINMLKKNMKEMEDALKNLVKDMQNVARSQDIKVLERYINMFDPTRFLTKEEAVELIRREIGRV